MNTESYGVISRNILLTEGFVLQWERNLCIYFIFCLMTVKFSVEMTSFKPYLFSVMLLLVFVCTNSYFFLSFIPT